MTAGDASDGPAPRVSASLLKLATGKPDRGASRPRSLLHKLAQVPALPPSPLLAGFRNGSAEEGGAGGAGGSAGSAPSSARSSGAGEEDPDLGGELEEGQLLRFTIALSQVASIERQDRRLKARPGYGLGGRPCASAVRRPPHQPACPLVPGAGGASWPLSTSAVPQRAYTCAPRPVPCARALPPPPPPPPHHHHPTITTTTTQHMHLG